MPPFPRRAGAPLLAALLALAIVPPAEADSNAETQVYVTQNVSFSVTSPAAGSGYFVKSSCANGQPCIHIDTHGWVKYTFTVTQRADRLFAHGTGNVDMWACNVTYDYVDPSGTGRSSTLPSSCPSRSGDDWGRTSFYPYEPTSAGAQFSVTLLCVATRGCTGFDLHTFGVEVGHEKMRLYTRPVGGTQVFTRCVDVQVGGSLWHPPDYLRMNWGDGTETFVSIDWDTWVWWNWGLYTTRLCHSYSPSTLPYQACVTAHDGLNRLLRGCEDLAWYSV